MATDPVCGMQVDEQPAKPSSEFGGAKYFFCSAGCKSKFDANPSAYLNRPSAVLSEPPVHAHVHADQTPPPASVDAKPAVKGVVAARPSYTCPMHPEIVRDRPGSCPKCGMALVPMVGDGAARRAVHVPNASGDFESETW